MTNRYQYRTLQRSRGEVRLLKLLPYDGNDKLKFIPTCNIFHVSLHTKPRFTALSYVWGAAADSRLILLESSPVLVTKNLYDAMMALRPTNEHIIMWIDSLCINQLDDAEKSWQVTLMADIYRQAEKVVAWLGAADDQSDSVMDYLNSLGAQAEACGMDNGPEPFQEIWQKLASNLPGARDLNRSNVMMMTPAGKVRTIAYTQVCNLFYSISGRHDPCNPLPLAGIKQLFTRPWWGRVWVLQEITLSENAEFICGTKRLTRRRCTAAFNAYCALRFILMEKFTRERLSLTRNELDIIRLLFQHRPTVMLSSWNIYRYGRFPLAALLRATCVGSINLQNHGPHHLESTDPRDKIFALLSLAADQEELADLGVFPDYTKSCKEIYTTTMAALLQQGHISLLSCCQMPKSQSGLPSWVLDWSRSVTDMLQDVENDHIVLYPQFSASGTGPSEITIIKKKDVIEGLSVVGHIYDEIREVGRFPGRTSSHEVPLEETDSWPVKWLVELLRLTYYDNKRYTTFSDRLRAAASTSIGGVWHDQNTRLARVRDDCFFGAVDLLQNGIKYITEHQIKRKVYQLLANKATQLEARASAAHVKLDSEIMGKSLGRLPFITREGNLVLSSEHVKRGDFIALIRGAQVPFVLRRQSGEIYQLISEAYVDGIMDGEVIEQNNCGIINLV